MSYAITINGNNYALTSTSQDVNLTLSRTGGQGAKGDSITNASIDSNGDFHVIISNSAGQQIQDVNLGGANLIASITALKVATETAADAVDDVFLGSKSSAPSQDNDGNALQNGAMYFDTTTSALGVYNVNTWQYPIALATTSATNAASSATAAATSATSAATSATAANTSKVAAETAETNAETAETNAATSATNASASASTATTKAANAATSETNAATSETNAGNSATSATTSATSASNSATSATASKTAAATSETNAANSAASAGSSATAAANSATTAGNHSSNAAANAVSAANSATSATAKAAEALIYRTGTATDRAAVELLFDNFDDKFLGTKASDPTLDNDGNALVEGSMYYNSTNNAIKFYNGTAWESPEAAASNSATAAATSATSAATSAAASLTSANNSAGSASTASNLANNAGTSATAASNSATAAATSATNAATSATNAATSATNSATSETNAGNSATAAATSATNSANSATASDTAKTAAQTAKTAAETAETNAETAETNAGNSATAAATSATNAANSATAAATSASGASTSATNAATSATNSATSETNAGNSATAAASSASSASTSATNAATSATNAGNSATSAATSATNAATSASGASTSATNAATSASGASTSATNAATSATAAQTAQAATELAFDNFDDKFLGTKSSDPSVDNDGNALVEGAMYYNSTDNVIKFYSGSAWQAPSVTATNAATSATTSATSASTSATNAGNSATAAATSATNASNSATAANTSKVAAETAKTAAETAETNAASSATAAASSATGAASSATAAQTAQTAAETALDSFDDRYLGSKSSNPSVDNDGNALITGALYFNSTDSALKVYDGSSWGATASTTEAIQDVVGGLLTAGTGITLNYNDAGNSLTISGSAQYANSNVDSHLNTSTASSGEYLSWNGSDYDWASVPAGYANSDVDTHLNTGSASSGQYLGWNGSDYAWATVDTSTLMPKAGGTMTGDILYNDSIKAKFGNSSDLQIYHDSSNNNSYIKENGSGHLIIQGQEIQFDNASGTSLVNLSASQVEILHGGSKKLETESTGIAVTGNITVSGTVDSRDLVTDGQKLDTIETNATADQTAAEIRTLVESATDSNVFTDSDHTKLNNIEASADVTDTTNVTAAGALMDSEVTNLAQVKAFNSSDYATAAQGTKADNALPKAGGTLTGDIDGNGNKVLFGNVYSALSDLPSASTYHGMFAHVHATGKGYYAHAGSWVELANQSAIVTYTVGDGGLTQNNFTNTLKSKLNAIEASATADQTGAEIKALYEAEANAYTDTKDTKLSGIETGATADQTAAEIRTLVESATDSNVFTDADHTKLNNIEASADVTDTTNVTAAGALMDSEVTNLAQVKAFDSSDYATAAQGTTADAALPKAGGTFTGDVTFDGATAGRDILFDRSENKLNFAHDTKLTIGDNDELEIQKHTTGGVSLSYTKNGGGNLSMKSDSDIDFKVSNQDRITLRTSSFGGQVELYNAGSKKFETSSSGVNVIGNITVSGTVDGRNVATDGSKLDGIESNATADQTSNEILTSIKTVDGATSGLDSDLLDGQHGSYYTGYTDTAISNLVDSSPAALNTLNELAAALGDDANFSTTVTTSIGTKLPLAGGTMTGTLNMNGGIVKSSGNTVTASGSSTTINMTSSNFHVINMQADTTFTLSNLANAITSSGTIVIKQDATGGRDFTLPSSCKTPVGGATITQYTGANSTSVLSYMVVSSTEVLVNYIGNFA